LRQIHDLNPIATAALEDFAALPPSADAAMRAPFEVVRGWIADRALSVNTVDEVRTARARA
jgi:hypothetical protein